MASCFARFFHFLLFVSTLLCKGGTGKIVINEINMNSWRNNGEGKFVELKFGDFCLFKRMSTPENGPSMDGYFLVFLDGTGKIKLWLSLSGHHFKTTSPYFTVGISRDKTLFDWNIHETERYKLVRELLSSS